MKEVIERMYMMLICMKGKINLLFFIYLIIKKKVESKNIENLNLN